MKAIKILTAFLFMLIISITTNAQSGNQRFEQKRTEQSVRRGELARHDKRFERRHRHIRHERREHRRARHFRRHHRAI